MNGAYSFWTSDISTLTFEKNLESILEAATLMSILKHQKRYVDVNNHVSSYHSRIEKAIDWKSISWQTESTFSVFSTQVDSDSREKL